MDNQKLRWVGNEAEFAAFFADFGFEVPFDNSSSELHAADFNVGPAVLQEWAKFISVHNEACRPWVESSPSRPTTLGIRNLVRE